MRKIYEGYEKGFSMQEISEDAGVSKPTVRKYLKFRSKPEGADAAPGRPVQQAAEQSADSEGGEVKAEVFTEVRKEVVVTLSGHCFKYRIFTDNAGGASVTLINGDFRQALDAQGIQRLITELEDIQRRIER